MSRMGSSRGIVGVVALAAALLLAGAPLWAAEEPVKRVRQP